jgi:hypothetical protein
MTASARKMVVRDLVKMLYSGPYTYQFLPFCQSERTYVASLPATGKSPYLKNKRIVMLDGAPRGPPMPTKGSQYSNRVVALRPGSVDFLYGVYLTPQSWQFFLVLSFFVLILKVPTRRAGYQHV